MNSEAVDWESEGVNHSVIPPDAYLHELLGDVGNEVDVDLFVEWCVGYLDHMVEERDAAGAVDPSGLAQAEDILR